MAPKYILEQFLEAELLVNITEHQVNVSVFLQSLNCCSVIVVFISCEFAMPLSAKVISYCTLKVGASRG